MKNRDLSSMTLEELWELFPIFLEEHKDCWKQWFCEEKVMLEKIMPQSVAVNHIGSTAISKIWAKPIIDILVEIAKDSDMDSVKQVLMQNGYICMSESKNRKSFNKGYTVNGFADKVFHLHLRYEGDNDEIYFRDYLIANKFAAAEYEKLKLDLWKRYEHNRDAYTDRKTDFVRKYTELAKKGNNIVSYGEEADINSWMELVAGVSDKFPGLETQTALAEHRNTVLAFMERDEALCIRDGNAVVGVLLFSKVHNMICCLAVSADYRNRGIASMLLSAAISFLDRAKDIIVSTFREDDMKGTAPRALYKKFGFIEDELIEEFGYPSQKFILKADT